MISFSSTSNSASNDELDIQNFKKGQSIFMVRNWCRNSPQNFRFTAKFPKIITHDKRLKDVDKELERFFEVRMQNYKHHH